MRILFFVFTLIFLIYCLNVSAVVIFNMLGNEVEHAFWIRTNTSDLQIELLGNNFEINLFIKNYLNKLADFFSSVMLYNEKVE